LWRVDFLRDIEHDIPISADRRMDIELHTLLPIRVVSPTEAVQRFRYDAASRLVWAEDSTHSAGRDSVTYVYGSTNAPHKPITIRVPRDSANYDVTTIVYNTLGLPSRLRIRATTSRTIRTRMGRSARSPNVPSA
jgi:hypothetical protein